MPQLDITEMIHAKGRKGAQQYLKDLRDRVGTTHVFSDVELEEMLCKAFDMGVYEGATLAQMMPVKFVLETRKKP